MSVLVQISHREPGGSVLPHQVSFDTKLSVKHSSKYFPVLV